MKDLIEKAKELHKLFHGEVVREIKSSERLMDLRESLITEEYKEVAGALLKARWTLPDDEKYAEGLAELICELADLVVVTVGTVVAMGLSKEFEQAYQLIYDRNMAKAMDDEEKANKLATSSGGLVYRIYIGGQQRFLVKNAKGKILKPPGLANVPEIIEQLIKERVNE